MFKQLILLQKCQKKHFWSLTYLFRTIHYVNSENFGMRGLLWSISNSSCGKWWKAKIRNFHNWAPICHRFTISTLKICFRGWESSRIGENSLHCNKCFKIQDGFQLWSYDSGYKTCMCNQPLWNNYYWYEHAKTCSNSYVSMYDKVQIWGFIAYLKPFYKCSSWKIPRRHIRQFRNSASIYYRYSFMNKCFGVGDMSYK